MKLSLSWLQPGVGVGQSRYGDQDMFKALGRGLAAFESGPAQLKRLVDETGLIVNDHHAEHLFINTNLQALITNFGHQASAASRPFTTANSSQSRPPHGASAATA